MCTFVGIILLAFKLPSSLSTEYYVHLPLNNLQMSTYFFCLTGNHPSHVKRGRSLEILHRDLFKNAWRPVCVHLSPPPPHTPVKLEAWKLACIILTWIAPKLLIRFLIFWLEAEIFISPKVYIYLLNSSHNFKARENFINKHFFQILS